MKTKTAPTPQGTRNVSFELILDIALSQWADAYAPRIYQKVKETFIIQGMAVPKDVRALVDQRLVDDHVEIHFFARTKGELAAIAELH